MYDSRNRACFGHTDRFELSLPAGEAAFFALLRNQPESLDIALSEKVLAKGELLEYRLALVPAGTSRDRRVYRVTVTDPHGRAAWHYADTLFAAGGNVTGRVQTALNDPPGPWQIAAVDVATGTVGSASFLVQARPAEE